jgi:predicted small secreted protein
MIRLTASVLATSLALTACNPSAPVSGDIDTIAPEADLDTGSETETETDLTEILADPDDIETVGYPEGWEMQLYWSGEYPNGFAVTQEGTTVMGHETITFGEYPPIYCGLPHKATYSPWNVARMISDELVFVAMTFPTTFTINEDVSLEVFVGDGVEQLDLKAGDTLTYKSYIAEGFFIAEKDGVSYEMNEAALPQSTEFEQGPEDEEWVQVTCADAEETRAWVRYEQALQAPGVEPYEYKGFGEAADLP